MTEKVDDFLATTSQETVFVYQVGTNNVVKGRSEEVLRKQRIFVGKLRDSRRQSVVCNLLPRCDVSSLILRRMLGINDRVKGLCSCEEDLFVDVWDHFICDRRLFANDGLHLICVGKARLGQVLAGEVMAALKRGPVHRQCGMATSSVAGRNQHSDSEVN